MESNTFLGNYSHLGASKLHRLTITHSSHCGKFLKLNIFNLSVNQSTQWVRVAQDCNVLSHFRDNRQKQVNRIILLNNCIFQLNLFIHLVTNPPFYFKLSFVIIIITQGN